MDNVKLAPIIPIPLELALLHIRYHCKLISTQDAAERAAIVAEYREKERAFR